METEEPTYLRRGVGGKGSYNLPKAPLFFVPPLGCRRISILRQRGGGGLLGVIERPNPSQYNFALSLEQRVVVTAECQKERLAKTDLQEGGFEQCRRLR